jgi:hypothetical protein
MAQSMMPHEFTQNKYDMKCLATLKLSPLFFLLDLGLATLPFHDVVHRLSVHDVL